MDGNARERELGALTTDLANALPSDGPEAPQSGCLTLLQTLMADVFVCRDGKGTVYRKQQKHDVAWLQSAATGPFSFLWCCAHLGLDPDAVRRAYFSGHGLPDRRFKRVNRHPLLVA